MVTDESLAQRVATALLDVGAVSLAPDEPFTWASGMRSPIYCDNRITLSDPAARTDIAEGFAQLVRERFPDANAIAGTATAGIPQAALVADRLDLPMMYVRAQPKDHGRGQQIEGRMEEGAKVVLIEDLISTGGSVLAAATAVTAAGGEVLGVLAVFSYELPAATLAFANAGIDLITLSNYPTLLSVASERGDLTQEQQEALANWSASPQEWSDRFEAGD